ncbi:carboxymuconolactone decarboxylase family protein [Aspergillus glaucus CBS 516.65]|uniref:Carboxymuconolactone decarboxylase-like domain-containing protein n=1 Tax=Aspergillus glaucus CBS 516.65 TaxID=1160497 RepID=A0A1L9VPM0_ASPGL|nr:hypothetical protein ASPGLDRAFT_24023 [Aspergillus glaucus CBS 516.65]OJJ85830.1 hypothetical protein ASPGLDRAFT_24023 [Aspergillus glaucus CBS 516.65]
MAQQPSDQVLLGAQMRREFMGKSYHLNCKRMSWLIIPQKDDIFSNTSREYIVEVCFSSYARPGLKFRDRSLMNIAILTALNRGPELRIHITAALHNGLTEEEICEACRHTMVYCGVPAGRDALLIASDVVSSVDNQRKA